MQSIKQMHQNGDSKNVSAKKTVIFDFMNREKMTIENF